MPFQAEKDDPIDKSSRRQDRGVGPVEPDRARAGHLRFGAQRTSKGDIDERERARPDEEPDPLG